MVRKAIITAHAKKNESWSSQNAQRFEVATSKGDAAFWSQVYAKVREIEEVRHFRVVSITVTESGS